MGTQDVATTNANEVKMVKYSAVMSIVCGVILSMGALHMDTINWILPTIANDLSAGHSTLMVTSGFFYGMMIGHVLVLPLCDAIGKKTTMIFGFVICVVGAVIGANSGALGGLIAARMIQGVGGAFSSTASRSVGGDAGKGKASAIALTFMQIWSALFPFFLPQLGKYVGNSFGWPAIFWLHAILCGILCVLTLIFVTETAQIKGQGMKVLIDEVKMCLATKEYVLFVLCFAFNMALFFCYAGSASFAMQTELGMDATTYANMYSVNALTMVVSAAIGRAIAVKISPDKIIKVVNIIQLATAVFISVSFMAGFADWHWLMFVWWVFPFCQGMRPPPSRDSSSQPTILRPCFMHS